MDEAEGWQDQKMDQCQNGWVLFLGTESKTDQWHDPSWEIMKRMDEARRLKTGG
jgi:hypothetical protein